MRTRKQKIYLSLKIFAILFVALIIAFFIFREALLQTAIARVSAKIERDYDSNFNIKEAHFQGLLGVDLTEITLVPKNADTLFKIGKMKTSVNFWHLFVGDIQLGTLDIRNGYVQIVKNKSGKNYENFLKKDSTATATVSNEKRDYAEFTYRVLSKMLNLVPTDMSIENLSFFINDFGKKARVDFQKLRLVDEQLESSIKVQTNTFTQRWRIAGFTDPRDKKADIRFFNLDTGAIKMPYIDERFNIKSSFDSVRLKIDNIDMDGDELHIDGFSSIAGLKVNHPKIASKDVVIKNARFDYHFLLGSDFVSVDSSSTVHLNKLKFHPYLAFNTASDTIYSLKVDIPKMKAQDFISSLPDGLFTHFQGMEAEGNFSYNLNFMFNKNKPNTLIFDSKLDKENLKITKYGEADLNKLNGDFVYHAIDKGKVQRGVLVGQANPDFTPLSEISPYLRKAVLTTEDPSFFTHRGFISEAFKQSIIKNIKTKKFSRGASTISMQLIKNVFLTREKTLSRKLEEILLVYILENNRIASKERMLEVYFNIIEWGPNVYGIGEASRFYFGKMPSALSLNECIYLATIIPRPKGFMYQFNDQGNLKGFAIKQQSFLTNIMMRRGLLAPGDTIYKSLPVFISGSAKSYIRIRERDTIPTDSLQLEDEFNF
ncbi:MAG: transglycosylase domain-containing protein [Flavobacterium sp.]|nr:transglycosylase domain-containing protein [Flavobacterium sp.]